MDRPKSNVYILRSRRDPSRYYTGLTSDIPATLAWVDWFSTRRLLGPIGDIPPAEFEAQYYAQAAVA